MGLKLLQSSALLKNSKQLVSDGLGGRGGAVSLPPRLHEQQRFSHVSHHWRRSQHIPALNRPFSSEPRKMLENKTKTISE